MAYNPDPRDAYSSQSYGSGAYGGEQQQRHHEPPYPGSQQQPQYNMPYYAGQGQTGQAGYGGGAAPGSQQQPQHGASDHQWIPTVDGLSFNISNRDAYTVLNVRLPPGSVVKSKSGAMVQMSPTVTLEGKLKFSFKKMFTGAQIAESTYTGPGEVSLAPTLFGDITAIQIEDDGWMLTKESYLASTAGISKDTKSQGLGKALFSGEDLFVYRILGRGMLWITSFGAIMVKELRDGEQHIVDNGHLVAWTCSYSVERVGKSTSHTVTTGEGAVCRFTGPGKIYLQSRNLTDFADWVRSQHDA